ncbi:Aryl carrier domain-containing protein [Pseudonocardia thermophila]|jgi:Aryl carrier domain|uniref:Aryl carrier domain-containing protein n=1 Tax=Pseudonocardia thermophila TaxID=1848 RepID=A0A1M7B1D1_PSETH|nr:phosphopantetheine-binding protein [Pseudonocardia thermophila]SHL48828.1 Aryl carrier domain-containing protein [Pseudonocardia thermophila]
MKVTAARATADVAEVLCIPQADLDPELDLRDQGMDSVRVMELVELWRGAGIEKLDYPALAEDQRLSRWLQVLAELQDSADGAGALIG